LTSSLVARPYKDSTDKPNSYLLEKNGHLFKALPHQFHNHLLDDQYRSNEFQGLSSDSAVRDEDNPPFHNQFGMLSQRERNSHQEGFSRNFEAMEKLKNNSTTNKNRNGFQSNMHGK